MVPGEGQETPEAHLQEAPFTLPETIWVSLTARCLANTPCVCVRFSTKPKKMFLDGRLVRHEEQMVTRSSSLTDS